MSVQIYIFLFSLIMISILFVSILATFKVTKKDFSDKIKLDVAVEQMRESENTIRLFLNRNAVEAGESIDKIAKILNIRQGGVEQGIQGQACLREDNLTGEKIVTFKEGLSEIEKKFIYAHEIAHILNGDTIPAMRPIGYNKPQVEQLADYTAAALLLPLDSVFDFLMENNYKESSARKKVLLVHQLCKRYEVTEMIVLRRIKEVFAIKS